MFLSRIYSLPNENSFLTNEKLFLANEHFAISTVLTQLLSINHPVTQMKDRITLLCLMIVFSTKAQLLDGGNGHSIILDKNGTVWTIGRNNYGQLGDSTYTNSPEPVKVKGLEKINVVSVSRGYDHNIALDKNGDLYLWGRNNYHQLGCISVESQVVPVKLPNHTNFIAIEGGYWHTAALKKDGTVWCWGHNYYAELGNGTREHSSWPVQVLQLSDNRTSVLNDVISIASVGYHTLALKSDGTLWGWGSNSFNELGKEGDEFQLYARQIQGLPALKQMAAGWHHSVGLDTNGDLWVWGSDPAFQFGESTLKKYDHPTRLKGLPKFTKIACGSWHSLAIDEDKNVWGWGKNHYGMLGLGDTLSRSAPVLIKSLKNIVDIGAGCFQSLALNSDGNIFTFGDNPSGQLGIGNYSRCFSPKCMNLDINGLNSSTKKEVKTIILHPETYFTPNPKNELLLKCIKYSLFLISILLNWILFRKIRFMKGKS